MSNPATAIRIVERIQDQSDFVAPAGGLLPGQVLAWNDSLQKFTAVTPAAGVVQNYTHTQAIASTTWTVNHNLGFKPSVTVVDTAGTLCFADIVHVNENQLIVSTSAAMGGVAYCS